MARMPGALAVVLPMWVLGVSWPCLSPGQLATLALSTAMLGALSGLYIQYRARFGVATALGMSAHLACVLIALPAMGLLAMSASSKRTDLYVWSVGAPGAALCVCLAISLARQHLACLRAQQAGTLAMVLGPFADLDRRILRSAIGQPETPAGGLPLALVGALAVNLPLIARGLDIGRLAFLGAVAAVVTAASAYLLVTKVGPTIARLCWLRHLERQGGWHFKRDRAVELSGIRQSFRGARWLCRPEDLAEPQAPESSSPSTHSMAAKTRRQRQRAAATNAPAHRPRS